MTDDLAAALTAQLQRFETGRHRGEDLPLDSGLSCVFEATSTMPGPGGDGPWITAEAGISPGGQVEEVTLEARDGDRSLTVDVLADSALSQALQGWFFEFWWSWDEVPQGTPGEVFTVPAGGLQAGDYVWRCGVTVAGIRESGVNTAGESMVAVSFENTEGVEVWPADRLLTVVRDGGGRRCR